MIRLSSSTLTPPTASPLTTVLYSPPISSRLSSSPLCLYFHYYMHDGMDGRLSVDTVDNADRITPQWTQRGGYLMYSWRVAFIQINSSGGPFQVGLLMFRLTVGVVRFGEIYFLDEVSGKISDRLRSLF